MFGLVSVQNLALLAAFEAHISELDGNWFGAFTTTIWLIILQVIVKNLIVLLRKCWRPKYLSKHE